MLRANSVSALAVLVSLVWSAAPGVAQAKDKKKCTKSSSTEQVLTVKLMLQLDEGKPAVEGPKYQLSLDTDASRAVTALRVDGPYTRFCGDVHPLSEIASPTGAPFHEAFKDTLWIQGTLSPTAGGLVTLHFEGANDKSKREYKVSKDASGKWIVESLEGSAKKISAINFTVNSEKKNGKERNFLTNVSDVAAN